MARKPGKLARGLYPHPKTGIIWCRFWVNGDEKRRSCKTRDPKTAAVEARRLRVEAEQAQATDPAQLARGEATLEELGVEDLLEHRRRGVTEDHRQKLENKWVVVLKHLPRGIRADEIDYDTLRAYEGRRREDGARGQTIVREFQCIKRALKIALRRGLIAQLPPEWPSVRRDPPDKRRAGKLWPPELLADFIEALHTDARDEVLLALLTGLRLAELKRVEPGWVEPAPVGSTTPFILRVPEWAAKGRKERVVGLPLEAHAIMRRRIEAQPRSQTVLSPSNFKKHRKAVARRPGWPTDPTMRDMRHTYATLALAGTSDPVAVMRFLGHRDLAMTERYLSGTIARTTAASAAVAEALKPDHPDRITDSEDNNQDAVSSENDLERATRLELATLSLGSGGQGRKCLFLLCREVSSHARKIAYLRGHGGTGKWHRWGDRC